MMHLWRDAIQKAVTGTLVATGLAASSAASGAPIVYDLRFAGYPEGDAAAHAQYPIPGSYQLELWVKVSGTNGTTAAGDEGLTNSYVTIMSSQENGGSVTSGGMVSGSTDPTFTYTGISRNGAPNELNSDGLTDWGSTSTAIANTNYMFARYLDLSPGGALSGGTIGHAVDADTWAFKIANFTLEVNGIGTGTTRFDVVKPSATSPTGVTYATGRVDGNNFSVTQANQAGAYTGSTGVVFSIPEPTGLALLGVTAVGVLGRRRASSANDR